MPELELPTVAVAAVHAAPVFLDLDATLDRVAEWTARAAAAGAELVVFGEAFVPGYPLWGGVLPPVDHHELHRRLVMSSPTVPGPTTERLGAIARRHGVVLSIGVNERDPHSLGQLWNANLVFDRSGHLVNHRRKLVATYYERLTWSHGDAHDLVATDLDGWRLGALICGENTNTLARFALLADGERLHVATYPPSWPFDSRPGHADYDLADAIRIRSAAHAFEGKVFCVVAATTLDDAAVDLVAERSLDPAGVRTALTALPTASLVVGPDGRTVGGPLLRDEGIVHATVDLSEEIVAKRSHDIVGTYNRADIFTLTVDRRRPGFLG